MKTESGLGNYRGVFACVVTVAAMLALACGARAAFVTSGLGVSFNHPNYSGLASQDHITPLVSLTRGNDAGLFNAVSETGYANIPASPSPLGTEWAFRALAGNPVSASQIEAANYVNLLFHPWAEALDDRVGNNIVGRPGVLHLVSEDVYLNIVFDSWTRGSVPLGTGLGGGFSYHRSDLATLLVPVPEPSQLAASAMVLLGLGAVVLRGHLRRGWAK